MSAPRMKNEEHTDRRRAECGDPRGRNDCRAPSRLVCRNNPWVAAAVDFLVGNIVGAGIKPQSTQARLGVAIGNDGW